MAQCVVSPSGIPYHQMIIRINEGVLDAYSDEELFRDFMHEVSR